MKKKLTEKEIDKLVVAQADSQAAWEIPIFVNRKRAYTLIAEVAIDDRKPTRTGRPKNGKSGGRRLKTL
jgi:hypothetical protein